MPKLIALAMVRGVLAVMVAGMVVDAMHHAPGSWQGQPPDILACTVLSMAIPFLAWTLLVVQASDSASD